MRCLQHKRRSKTAVIPRLRLGFSLLAAASSIVTCAAAADYSAPPGSVRLHALVVPAEHADLSFQEAGILKEVVGADGKNIRVDQGQIVMRLDDTKAQAELLVAQAKLVAAQTKADDDINIRYAKSATDVAKNDLQYNRDANDPLRGGVPGSVPKATIADKELKYLETKLSIEKADLDFRVAQAEAKVAAAEVQAAQTVVDLMKVKAPFDGEVDVVRKHVGEAVQPNEPGVVHIVNRNKLRVQAEVSDREYAREQMDNQPVTVQVHLAGGKTFSVQGRVIYTSPQTTVGGNGGMYQVRAEVLRPSRDAPWPVYPGMQADMFISPKPAEATR